jgi:hypothetical protein
MDSLDYGGDDNERVPRWDCLRRIVPQACLGCDIAHLHRLRRPCRRNLQLPGYGHAERPGIVSQQLRSRYHRPTSSKPSRSPYVIDSHSYQSIETRSRRIAERKKAPGLVGAFFFSFEDVWSTPGGIPCCILHAPMLFWNCLVHANANFSSQFEKNSRCSRVSGRGFSSDVNCSSKGKPSGCL